MTTRTALALALACLVGVGACAGASGGAVDAGGCLRVDPTCTGTVPSYQALVQPIVEQACATCHYPGSALARTSLVTYADVSRESGTALGQVSACLMPPANAPPLTGAERAALLSWLACGAPDN